VGFSAALGLVVTPALARTLQPNQRVPALVAILTASRAPVLGAVAGVFITGFFNIARLTGGVGAALLIKMLLAVTVAGHALAIVNGVAGKLQGAMEGGDDAAAVIARAERSCQRLALSQLVLVAIIVLLSVNL